MTKKKPKARDYLNMFTYMKALEDYIKQLEETKKDGKEK